jgi:hypothetical protein
MVRHRNIIAVISALFLFLLIGSTVEQWLKRPAGKHSVSRKETPQQEQKRDLRASSPAPEAVVEQKYESYAVPKTDEGPPERAPRGQRPPKGLDASNTDDHPSRPRKGGRPPKGLDASTMDDLSPRPRKGGVAAGDRNFVSPGSVSLSDAAPGANRNACIVTLCRNSDLKGVIHSLSEFEDMWNAEYRYPYIFMNDVPFTPEFINGVRGAIADARGVSATQVRDGIDVEFGLVPIEHWQYPFWINLTIADQWRQDMSRAGVIYGGSESYRKMCRFYSGFFFRHPLVQKYRWYWRLEPDVDYYCKLDYDPFVSASEDLTIFSSIFALNTPLVAHVGIHGRQWQTLRLQHAYERNPRNGSVALAVEPALCQVPRDQLDSSSLLCRSKDSRL